jgi:hypothetical protein
VAVSIFIGFVAAFAMALLEFRGARIISRFAVRWELARAASLFATWMPPLLFAACAASMSLYRERSLRFSQLLRPVLIPALVMPCCSPPWKARSCGNSIGRRILRIPEPPFQDALKEAEWLSRPGHPPRAQERVALCGVIDSGE